MDIPAVLIPALAGVLGLLIGSFLNVVIYRLPVMMEREWTRQARAQLATDGVPAEETEPERFNLAVPGSACPSCQAPIRAWQNIPVLSYLLLRGRCSACGTSISPRYPAIELTTGLLSALAIWHYGATLEGAGALLLTWSLIALTFIDFDTQLLPDSITLPLLWAGIGLGLIAGPATADVALFPSTRDAVIGALAGYLSLWSVYHLFRLATGKEGMGYGDFKLLAALGAWLGWQLLPLVILLSAVVGSVVGIALIVFTKHGREVPIPFGPYLAAAGFIAMLWGPQIVVTYLKFLSV